ncbi:DNA-binding helix-turn-helix protein [Marvinbryantia formatexigens DSM 14469]|uniref:DNA-binding helix-turn-helix protein n=1 Tax=Marvinbryantia formatexigens DSM 14469 TaxID=478749 RepID=C6LL47_9FIRM|nr:helix-turn-helix transcriptional regulator [Marvinbryantia formatexigens]EET58666.1 DNA-binding helix-turn-helix protein [Marvinbryantia formatexigens DSM 14469]UWO23387.1 helix-turn-helix domain-containing protein [Marvinbryantia formatexigens DSM 14469]SDG39084.1 DNA-binding transcriptional regulator, XRE-family HTH domain [Marvinbryantia formatexigens]
MKNNSLGKKLRALRERRHLTQAEVSALLHIERAAYSNYENDKRIPSFETLLLIADFYGVPVEYLIRSDYAETPRHRKHAAEWFFQNFGLLDPGIQETIIAFADFQLSEKGIH